MSISCLFYRVGVALILLVLTLIEFVTYLCYRVSVANERCQSHICVTGLVLPVRGVSLIFVLQG